MNCQNRTFLSFYILTILGKSQFVRKPLKTLGKSRVLTFGTNRTNQNFSSLHITPIKSNAETLEKPKKIKDSERVTK